MQFTDSHIHLQDYKTKDAQQIISDLQAEGFYKIVCVSTSSNDWAKVAYYASLAKDFVVPAFGVHPWYLSSESTNFIDILINYLTKFPDSWVGECGLDKLKTSNNITKQEEIFKIQIDIAKEFNRPLNIHLLKAEQEMVKFLSVMPKSFMFHSFSGSKEFLLLSLKKGAYISLSQSILRRKNHLEIISLIPLNRLLLESDAPFLSDYKDIPLMAQYIATVKRIDYVQLLLQVNQNFEEFCHGK